MTALALIDQARADGLELRPNGDRLKLRGPADVVARWKPCIAAHKPEIMDALAATASRWWLIHFLDGAPLEVACFPPATWAEILERHPDAIAAEPINRATPAETIPPDLEHLIVRAGTYWEYSPEDYRLMREVARREPDGLRRVLENDVAFSRTVVTP